jgi:hypothetical protein
MKNFYLKYDCTQLSKGHGIHRKGPNAIEGSHVVKEIIPFYARLKKTLEFSRKRGNELTVRVISNHDNFRIVDFELTGNDWHWKWRFGLDIELWSLLPEIKGD